MAEDTKQMAMDAEESAAIEDTTADSLNDEPTGQIESFVKSKFRKVEADEFIVATLLPVQRFKKQSDNYVFGKSRGMV